MSATSKTVDAVLDALREGLRHGRYAPGQRLVTSDLSAELRVSLSPVREALHTLAGEGLVEIEANKGARVRSLSPQTFVDGLQVLEAIGTLAFRLLEPKIEGGALMEQVPELSRAIVDAGKRRNPHAFFAAIARSHRAANEASGNSYLNPILNRLHLEYFYRQMADFLPDDFWDPYVRNYELMAECLRCGDVRGAERVWKRHIKWLIKLIEEHLERARASS